MSGSTASATTRTAPSRSCRRRTSRTRSDASPSAATNASPSERSAACAPVRSGSASPASRSSSASATITSRPPGADAMAMNGSAVPGDDVVPQMNVTPLVDVVLVLLITFMVIPPLPTKTFCPPGPQQRTEEVAPQPLADDPPLVLRLERDGTMRVNGTETSLDDLPDRLRRMFAARDDHVLFFDADDGVSYGFAVQAMDQARAGGAVTIGLLTQDLAATTP